MPKTTEEFNKEYDNFVNRRWVGPSEYSCYVMVRDYYREYMGITMRLPEQWTRLKIYSFNDRSLLLEGGEYTYRKQWGDPMDYSQLQKDDILLFKLYDTPLGGGYSAPKDRAPNHGGIYLGDGHLLHHPYEQTSRITNMQNKGFSLYETSCVGAVRVLHRDI